MTRKSTILNYRGFLRWLNIYLAFGPRGLDLLASFLHFHYGPFRHFSFEVFREAFCRIFRECLNDELLLCSRWNVSNVADEFLMLRRAEKDAEVEVELPRADGPPTVSRSCP